MAATDSTVLPESNPYAGRSLSNRVKIALELSSELRQEHERLSALVFTICDRLRPDSEGGESSEPFALALTEILEDRMADIGQIQRLLECLTLEGLES